MVRCAQAKGRSVGVIAEKDETTDKRVQDEGRAMRTVWAFGMWITCVDLAADTGGDGGGNEVKAEADEDAKPATLRAVISGKPVDPVDTEWYCRNKFRARWEDALKCFTTLANRCDPERIGVDGYGFYERFRPGVAAGAQGWGKSGELQLRAIVGMEL
ncbi:uncharacterized protein EV422DRAFT_541364 [Fimicolochytrium jonesii]|uniref:uncharacterized protein n=1 Tax=Fimicolochytrium jonesii TaxID=1396493 RepID=UPI0022FEAAD0|nr:uncharacterized protein EV422DRAFT_541364 [Fimicolochytrium jonesii]KAI8817606.1 hypothetical protein EV422DRAFT_541364 [Fimicolochytrium jonesii]